MTEFNSKIKKNSRILKIFMFSICALFACAISSHAQSLVKGTVTDGIGEPLPVRSGNKGSRSDDH